MNNSKQNFYVLRKRSRKDEYLIQELPQYETTDREKSEKYAQAIVDSGNLKKHEYIEMLEYKITQSVYKRWEGSISISSGISVIEVEGVKKAVEPIPISTVLYDPTDPKTHEVPTLKVGDIVVIIRADMKPYTMMVSGYSSIKLFRFDNIGYNLNKVAKNLNDDNVYIFGRTPANGWDTVEYRHNQIYRILV